MSGIGEQSQFRRLTVLIATGGITYPVTGSTGDGLAVEGSLPIGPLYSGARRTSALADLALGGMID